MNRMCACGALAVVGQRCERCRKPAREARPNSRERGYDYAWHTGLRARQLQREPLCQYVTSRGERCNALATDADHIVPKSKGGADALSNLQSLCHRHHSMKTASENPPRPRLPSWRDRLTPR